MRGSAEAGIELSVVVFSYEEVNARPVIGSRGTGVDRPLFAWDDAKQMSGARGRARIMRTGRTLS